MTYAAVPTETCGTISGGGGSGSMKLVWSRVSGATSYYVCGRTTGAELQLLNLGGVDSIFYTDTGGLTPSGSCNLVTTTLNGGVDQAGQVGINSLGTAFEVIHKAPAGLGANITITDPSQTGTLALNNVFGASGASHATGLVPDPGSSAGTARFLREDGT